MIVVHLRQDSTGKVEADARRIVACVNYCAGLETGDMINATESGNGAAESINALIAQRDEMLVALKEAKASLEWNSPVKAMRIIDAAIAKCEVKS